MAYVLNATSDARYRTIAKSIGKKLCDAEEVIFRSRWPPVRRFALLSISMRSIIRPTSISKISFYRLWKITYINPNRPAKNSQQNTYRPIDASTTTTNTKSKYKSHTAKLLALYASTQDTVQFFISLFGWCWTRVRVR